MKKDIKTFEFERLVSNEELPRFSKYYGIEWDWFAPQLLAALSNYDLHEKDGKIDIGAFINGLDARGQGMLRFCTISRSASGIVAGKLKWSDKILSPYCATVPLVLAAFKKYHGINYNRWAPASSEDTYLTKWRHNLAAIVEEKLFLAMIYRSNPPTAQECIDYKNWLATREPRLATAPASCFNIYRPHSRPVTPINSDLDNAPQLAKHMYMQTWVCHPTVRNEYMVLNPVNWDDMPAPLHTSEVIWGPTASDDAPWNRADNTKKLKPPSDNPWN